jgi:hypothetical protein
LDTIIVEVPTETNLTVRYSNRGYVFYTVQPEAISQGPFKVTHNLEPRIGRAVRRVTTIGCPISIVKSNVTEDASLIVTAACES